MRRVPFFHRVAPACLLLVCTGVALGDTYYVSPAGTHQAPYTNWSSAATTIQAAVDVAADGDLVLVTNGMYAAGTVVMHGSMHNRLAVPKAVTVQSVNGPGVTLIVGRGPLGDGSVRCAYLGSGARLEGFTLTNGHTRVSGDPYLEQSGGAAWCDTTAVVSNCVITGNEAGTTSAVGTGGYGGGVFRGYVYRCAFMDNRAASGGATAWSTVRNCLVRDNEVAFNGGGTYFGAVESSTIVGNHADQGGGTYYSTVKNCIVYYNIAFTDPNCTGAGIQYTCTSPPHSGTGNISTNPRFWDRGAGNLHLAAASPCIDTGMDQTWMGGTVDLDGNPRRDGTVDMGAYEFISDQNVHRYVSSAVVPRWPYLSWQTAARDIPTAMDAAADGDTVWVTNGVYDTGQTEIYGTSSRVAITKPITVRSANGPEHTIIVGEGPVGSSAVRCAYVGHGARLEGFTLTNGHTSGEWVYPSKDNGGGALCEPSGMLSNCTVQGNEAGSYGGGISGGSLYDCTIVSNLAVYGGGAHTGTLRNCVILGNTASDDGGGTYLSNLLGCFVVGNSSGEGGGAAHSTIENSFIYRNVANNGGGTYNSGVRNSLIVGNVADDVGGGAMSGGLISGTYPHVLSRLENCTVVGNSAGYAGGGTGLSILTNCIVYYNTAPSDPNFRPDWYPFLDRAEHCCTTPLPSGGAGNIANAPRFLNTNGWANLRLDAASPCIDVGANLAWMAGAADLDGLPRIIHGSVDMGAYEWPPLVIKDVHRPTTTDGPVIRWASFSNAHYAVYGSSNLTHGYDVLLQEHIPAYLPENAYTDTVDGVSFRGYRVEYEP